MTDEEGYAEQWPRTGMRLLCWFGRHDWYHLDHFPDGDQFPDGYIARRCKRCGKVQWDLRRTDITLPLSSWVNGWPKRVNPVMLNRKLNQVVKDRSVESFTVVCDTSEPGLTQEEKGTP